MGVGGIFFIDQYFAGGGGYLINSDFFFSFDVAFLFSVYSVITCHDHSTDDRPNHLLDNSREGASHPGGGGITIVPQLGNQQNPTNVTSSYINYGNSGKEPPHEVWIVASVFLNIMISMM